MSFVSQNRKAKIILFILPFVSILLVLTEGIGLSLLAPLLDSGRGNILKDVPFIGGYLGELSLIADVNERVISIAIIMAIVIFFRALFEYISSALLAIVPILIARDASFTGFDLFSRASMRFLISKNFGELSAAIQDQPDYIGSIFQSISTIFTNILLLIIYSTLLFSLSTEMTLFSIFCLLFMFIILKNILGSKLRRVGQKAVDVSIKRNKFFQEAVSSVRTTKLFVGEERMSNNYRAINQKYRDISIERALYEQAIKPLFMALAGFLICILLYLTTFVGSEAGIPTIILFIAVMFRMLGPVTIINNSWANISTAQPSLESVFEFHASLKQKAELSGHKIFKGISQKIEFRNLNFSYSGKSAVLSNIDFIIDKGKKVSIVGPSGAGKSTLVSLLLRMEEPSRQNILIDGVDMLEFDVHSWRKKVSVVSQDVFLFNDTVGNNIIFGGDFTEKEVSTAAKLANAHEFVLNLSDGYDTVIGDRGVLLSGGQQQRLSIARAFLRKPELLIFDEATSQLDSFAQHSIQQTIQDLPEGITSIIIAHRLSTVMHADIILVMDQGRIIQQGTHSELMRQGGLYKDMVEKQAFFTDEKD